MRKIIIILGLIPILLGLSSRMVSETTERPELPLDHGYDFLVYPVEAGGLINGEIITLYPGSRIMMIGDLVFPWNALTCKDGRGDMSMGTYTLHGDSLIYTPRYEFVHIIDGSQDTSYIVEIGACNPPGGLEDKWIYRFKVDSMKSINTIGLLIRSIERDTMPQDVKDFMIEHEKLRLYRDTSESFGYVRRYVGHLVDRGGQPRNIQKPSRKKREPSQDLDELFQPMPMPASYSDIPMEGFNRLDESVVRNQLLPIVDPSALYRESIYGGVVRKGLQYLARGRFDYDGRRFYILDVRSEDDKETRTYLMCFGDRGVYPRTLLIFDGASDTNPDGRNNRVNFTIADGAVRVKWWDPSAKDKSQCVKRFPLNSTFEWK